MRRAICIVAKSRQCTVKMITKLLRRHLTLHQQHLETAASSTSDVAAAGSVGMVAVVAAVVVATTGMAPVLLESGKAAAAEAYRLHPAEAADTVEVTEAVAAADVVGATSQADEAGGADHLHRCRRLLLPRLHLKLGDQAEAVGEEVLRHHRDKTTTAAAGSVPEMEVATHADEGIE